MRFCGECGTPLDVGATPPPREPRPFNPSIMPGAAPAGAGGSGGADATGSGSTVASHAPIAERRLVTVLFADLVGFTTISEGRDPEEVRELLSRYFDVAREQIERYGGTVEKFIGDAVMAVWGAPTAHEDDAERGVRAALEVVDSVRELAPGLQARAGVLTGEAAVTIGARGQGMVAGDLVNTASRLQSAAPPGVVLVGETTQRVTAGAIAYEPAGDHLLKGKAAPVAAYRAVRVVGRRGGAGRGDRLEAPFVGRDSELRLMKDLFHTTAREKRVRLVSVTGQAGVGKSRLAWEVRKYADGIADDVFWHEGRSPAYGQGITFWALGEMVRSRAQLAETDDPATTRTKIAATVDRFFQGSPDRDRVERALLALLGAGDGTTSRAEELFPAWRLFFERMAEQSLVLLTFEDLHWADPGTLDFIDHLLEWSRNVPILIVTLARPELLDHRPGWGAGRRNFIALHLEPLDETAMRELLRGLVSDLSEAATRSIVVRAEGIPLYAVETIRMLAADGRLRERPEGGFESVGELGELAVPDSLHALIAARLDALDPADRTLVQDAAVLGQSFTPAGLAAISGLEEGALLGRLRDLVRAELLVEERDERSPERGQFAFVQALIREVAYSTLSLRDRRSRHLAAARFFESLGDDELAGALAAHYLSAFRATTDPNEAAPLAAQARIALRGAADRAETLGAVRQAVTFLQQAREVATEPAEQADLLERVVQTAWNAADYDLALELLPQLHQLRESLGDRSGDALAHALEAETLYSARQRDKGLQYAREALMKFADMPDDPNVLRIMSAAAASATFTRDYEAARPWADQALASAERLGLPDVASRMLMIKGAIAQFQGRLWEAIALTDGGRRVAEQYGLAFASQRLSGALANLLALDDPRAAVDVQRQVIEASRRTGRRESEVVTLGNMAEDVRRTGEWDWMVGELEAATRDEDRSVSDLLLDATLSDFRIFRGQMTDDDHAALSVRLATLEDSDVSMSSYSLRAGLALVRGDYAAAAQGWIQYADGSDLNAPYTLPRAGHAAILAGDAELAQQVVDRLVGLGSRGRAIEADMAGIRAGIAGLRGDRAAALAGYRDVRNRFIELGLPWDVAMLALPAAVVLGTDDPEVVGWLGEARGTFERLRAEPLIATVDALTASVWTGRDAAAGLGGTGGRSSRNGAPAASTVEAEASPSS
jgi:class 3 adenylate cyclase